MRSLNPTRALGLGVIVWFALVAAFSTTPGTAWAQRGGFDVESTYLVPLADAPTRGSAAAPITLVEFSDFRCGYCVRAQARLRELTQLFGDKIRFVFRHNPLDMEDGSLAAEASYAARAQGQFWAMHDRLFASRGKITRDVVEGFAQELGLNMARFRRDLDSRAHLAAVKKDAKAARSLGATSTPMFFVNGRPVRGLQHLSVFAKVVRQELGKARKLATTGVKAKALYLTTVARGRLSATPGIKDRSYARTRLETQELYNVRLGAPGHSKGGKDALVTIVEFSDFQCSFCVRAQAVLRRIEKQYGKQVRFVFRHLPLQFHHQAPLAAQAAMAAAAQGKFWPYHDALFALNANITRANLDLIARKLKLDMRAFSRALATGKYAAAVRADAASGGVIGVDGTPSFFVNGTPISGAKPFLIFKTAIDIKLAEAKALVKSGVKPADVYQRVLKDATVVEPR